jgi:hypothetical protein
MYREDGCAGVRGYAGEQLRGEREVLGEQIHGEREVLGEQIHGEREVLGEQIHGEREVLGEQIHGEREVLGATRGVGDAGGSDRDGELAGGGMSPLGGRGDVDGEAAGIPHGDEGADEPLFRYAD